MNENQSILKNYILIVKTVHGEPDENISVCIKGSHGQTDKILLGKSQSYQKAFRDNQTDLFLLLSNIDVGKIYQIEFYTNINAKFKEWKYNHVFLINGTHVYHDIISEYSLFPSMNTPSVVNVSEPSIESQGIIRGNFQNANISLSLIRSFSFSITDSIYYAFVKTGSDSCSKEGYPKLSLFGNNQKYTEIDMKSSYRLYSPSTNHNTALQKYQFDIFQWQDHNIGNIERMRLQLYSENKQSKCQWPIQWMFVIHNQYSFTGRIMLNRILKIDRYIDINLEQNIGEYGDSFNMEKTFDNHIFPSHILNKQSNATTNDLGRYYVFIRNIDGTSGDVYIEFHGDQLSSSGEQHLLKCENYPNHPFSSKHTDLFHIKAFEVGHINSVSLRLDQTTKEYSITLDSLFIIHNAIMYQFDLKYIILNKEQPKKEFIYLSHEKLSNEKICYYIATHTADKMLAGTNAHIKIAITGTKGMLGPIELKESLTNGNNPFEKECIDLFHIEDDDIGDPISLTITLEPKGLLPHVFSNAKCERIMLVKNGEYNSLWQIVGDLKSKEPKTISLPIRQRTSIKDATHSPNISLNPLQTKTTTDQIYSIPKIKTEDKIEIKSTTNHISNMLSGDYDNHSNNLSMAMIEDHQKRHTFAPSLYQAQQNYRELRRLLKKMNGSISKEQKTQK